MGEAEGKGDRPHNLSRQYDLGDVDGRQFHQVGEEMAEEAEEARTDQVPEGVLIGSKQAPDVWEAELEEDGDEQTIPHAGSVRGW